MEMIGCVGCVVVKNRELTPCVLHTVSAEDALDAL
jgi:hypothetical protein